MQGNDFSMKKVRLWFYKGKYVVGTEKLTPPMLLSILRLHHFPGTQRGECVLPAHGNEVFRTTRGAPPGRAE